MRLCDRLQRWWQGTPVENDRNSPVIFLNGYRRHWTSEAAHDVWNYFKVHHQWIIGLAVAVILAVVVKTH
jgi:hypothetical protein